MLKIKLFQLIKFIQENNYITIGGMHKVDHQNKFKQSCHQIKKEQAQSQYDCSNIPLQSLYPLQRKIIKSCISQKYKEKLQFQQNKHISTKHNDVGKVKQEDIILINKDQCQQKVLYQNKQRFHQDQQFMNKISNNRLKQNNSINLPMQYKQNPYFHKSIKKVQNRPILKLLFESDVSNFENQIDYAQQSNFQQIKSSETKIKTKENLQGIALLQFSQIGRQKTYLQSINITQNQSILNKVAQSQSTFNKLTQNQNHPNKLQIQIKSYKQDEDEDQNSTHFYNQSTYRNSQRQVLKQEQKIKIQTYNKKEINSELNNYLQASSVNIATFKPKQLKSYLVEANKNISKLEANKSIFKVQTNKNISKVCTSKEKLQFSQSQRLKFLNNNTQTAQKSNKEKIKKLLSDNNRSKLNSTNSKAKINKIHDFDYLYQQTKPKTKYQAILQSYFNQSNEQKYKQKMRHMKQQSLFKKQINQNNSKCSRKRTSTLSISSHDANRKKYANKNQHIKTESQLNQVQNNNVQNLKKGRSESCSSLRKNEVAYYKKVDIYPQEKLQKTYSKAYSNYTQKVKIKTQPIQMKYEQQNMCNLNSSRWMSLNFYERQQKSIQNRKQKQEIGKKQKSIKEVNNCTFKPKLTEFKAITSSRQNSTTYAKMYLEKIRKRYN